MDENGSAQIVTPAKPGFRFFRAYLTTFVVLGSYLWLGFKSRFATLQYKEEKLQALNRKNAQRIEKTILTIQGLFIKVGQLFSIMTNFLPEEFRSGLQNLQDAVPARPYSQIEVRIEEELGGKPLDVFATFQQKSIASASLGQVHEATMDDGRRVAVKVQHMGVEAMARADLKTIRRIVAIVGLFLRVKGLDNFYREIRSMILEELDFTREAENIEAIARNFTGNDRVVFPRVIPELSTPRVLTLEYVEGIKITDRSRLTETGLDPSKVAQDLVTAYCQMIFVDGLYHADPHPGNLFVQEDGKLVFLDFGAVGHLSERMRKGISSFLEAIIKADEEQLKRSLNKMGFLQRDTQESDAVSRVIDHFHRRFQDEIHLESFSLSSVKIDTQKGLESLADLREMNVGIRELSQEFHVPKEWVLLERALLLLAGLCTHLDPEMNPTVIIRPYLEEFVLGRDRDWSEMLFDLAREKLLSFVSMPGHLEKLVNRTVAGQVSFKMEGFATGVERLYAGGRQLIYTLLLVTATFAGIYFYDAGVPQYTRYAAYTASGCGVLLILSMFRARRYKRR